MNNKTLNKIEQFVSQYSWENLPGDETWSNNFHSCALGGAKIAEKDLKQKITDLYNKYKSQHQQLTQFKLDKTVNEEVRIKMEAKLEVLKELKTNLNKKSPN